MVKEKILIWSDYFYQIVNNGTPLHISYKCLALPSESLSDLRILFFSQTQFQL